MSSSRVLMESFKLHHENLSLSTYHERPELGSTTLKTLADDGAEMAAARQSGEVVLESRALVVGSAIHAIIEGTFDDLYRSAPDSRGYGTATSATFDAASNESRAAGFVLLTANEFGQAKAAGESVQRKLASFLIGRRKWREPSLFWNQRAEHFNGHVYESSCKCRPDLVVDQGDGVAVYLEIKSAAENGLRAWRSACWRYGYWLQQSHYEAGILANGPDRVRTIFVVVRKSDPHIVRLYEFTEEDRMSARIRWLELVADYGRRLAEADWIDEGISKPTQVELGIQVADDLDDMESE